MSVNPVAPKYFLEGDLKKIYDNINTVKQQVTDATDGQGSDVASDISAVSLKLQNVGIVKNDGTVTSDALDVVVKDGTNQINDTDALKDATSPKLKLKVGTSEYDLDFDVTSYINVVKNHISELSSDKNLIYNVKSAVNSAATLINDSNTDIDSVTSFFSSALDQVSGYLDNLKAGIEELNTAVNGDTTSGKKGVKDVVGAGGGDFNSIKSAVTSRIQDILNDVLSKNKTISEGVKGIKDIILGNDSQYGYIDVAMAKKKVDLAKGQVENAFSKLDTYINTFSAKVSNLESSYNNLDKSIQIEEYTDDTTGDSKPLYKFALKDDAGNILEDNLNKLKNVYTIMATGTSYLKAQTAQAMANTLKDVASSITNALSGFDGSNDPTSMSMNTADIDSIKDDISTLKNNITTVANKLKDIKGNLIEGEGISTSNIQSDLTNGLSKVTVTLTNVFTISVDNDFKNVYKGVNNAKENGLDYMDEEINQLTTDITNENNWITKLNQINSEINNVSTQILNSTEASKIEGLLNGPNDLESKVENYLPTSQYAYDNFVNAFKTKLDYINQKKIEYKDLKTQMSNIAGQLMDAINNGEDTAPYLTQLSKLESQENTLVGEVLSWYSSLNTMQNTINNYFNQYSDLADDATSVSDKAIYQSVYGLLYVEKTLVDNLISKVASKLADTNSNGNYDIDEVEAFLDGITNAALKADLGADLYIVAGDDNIISGSDVPDINL